METDASRYQSKHTVLLLNALARATPSRGDARAGQNGEFATGAKLNDPSARWTRATSRALALHFCRGLLERDREQREAGGGGRGRGGLSRSGEGGGRRAVVTLLNAIDVASLTHALGRLFPDSLRTGYIIYVCIYIYIHTYMNIYIYVYIYIHDYIHI
jgi:hypothetical protein